MRPPWVIRSATALLLLSGCAHAPLKPDSLLGKDFAVIQSGDPDARIVWMDGHRVGGFWADFTRLGSLTEATLAPGVHVLSTRYFQGGTITSSSDMRMTAVAGHVYMLDDEVVAHAPNAGDWRYARMWIVDVTSVNVVSEVLETKNEPITANSPPFRQSVFFAWLPPEPGKWSILSRNGKKLTAVMNDGPSDSENSYISISMLDIPTLEAPEDLTGYIRTMIAGRSRPGPSAYEIIESTVAPSHASKEECVRYHHVELNKPSALDVVQRLATAFHKPRPMISDAYEYVCRIPNNRNLAVDFRLTRWAYERPDEAALSSRAEEAFARLKF